MAKKDFDLYFQKVANNYHEMILELKDMEKEFTEGVVSPEVYEQMQRIIEPIKRNYQMLNYVDYLLNMPVKKNKKVKYANQHKKQVEDSITDNQVMDENNKSIEELKGVF